MAQHACRLVRSPTWCEDLPSVAALATRILELRGAERPLLLRHVSEMSETPPVHMVAVRFADARPGEGAIGYVIVGKPALNPAVQYELLGAALDAALPDRAGLDSEAA